MKNYQHLLLQRWRYFILALGFFTRLPVPSVTNFQESDLNHAARYFPVVGLIVGLFAAFTWWLATQLFPAPLAVLCSMCTTIYLTGAFHEDGLADSADGLGGGLDKDRILTIMQDSRLGSYGAIALIGILLFKFYTLTALRPSIIPFASIAGHALSRLCAVYIMYTADYVRFSGKSKPLATALGAKDVWCASAAGLLPWGLFSIFLAVQQSFHQAVMFILVTIFPVSLVWIWWRRLILRNIQGYTGDTLGAIQQLTEVAFYLGILIWQRLA